MSAAGFVLTCLVGAFIVGIAWALLHTEGDNEYRKEAHRRFMAEVERRAKDDS